MATSRTRGTNWIRFLGFGVVLITLANACSTTDSEAAQEDQVAAMCDGIHELHSAIIDTANKMSDREVGATPEDRGQILAEGLETMIALVSDAKLPTEPEAFVIDLESRRQQAVADAELEADVFRTRWPVVQQDDRAGAVSVVFLVGEKLMAGTEPLVGEGVSPELVAVAQKTERCRFVVQLPPTE